ncbi:MAG TPA: DUF362 domain-containing protein [Patescibacteria group bacterium]|nr:DUF362 domain-containing protein [Patescibacteria group bacterium]
MDRFKLLLERCTRKRMSRGQFIKLCISGLALLPAYRYFLKPLGAQPSGASGRSKRTIHANYDLVAVGGHDPYAMTVRAIEAMGGMGRFVRKNDAVLIKPNMGWDRTPEQAANTNPLVVAALVELAFKAGAKKVNVFDITCNDPRRSYENSGIQKAAQDKGASVYFPEEWNSTEARFAYPSPLENWPILKDALSCDTLINVPVLKHHGLTGLTLSMKNLMGVCLGNRGLMHQDIGRKLVDLTDFLKPELTVIDAFRVLVRNGPTGGDVGDVVEKKTILASVDSVLADSYACRLVDVDPRSIPYLAHAFERGFGICDIDKARILKLGA